jgi:5-hydroxyisourate hydrolase-like protein (transthyretin family)
MKRSLSVLVLVTFLALAAQHAPATSCIQSKRFKVKQVCGVVVAPEGTPMPHVLVELIDLATDLPDVVQAIETDNEGRFALPDVPAGEYAMRVRLSGFATASQNFVVSKRGCKHPIAIQMQVAGRCSTISLAHKQ